MNRYTILELRLGSAFQLHGRGRVELAASEPEPNAMPTGASLQLADGTVLATGADSFTFETWCSGERRAA